MKIRLLSALSVFGLAVTMSAQWSAQNDIPAYHDAAPKKTSAFLLPHEFVHSWNGKFRRPTGLATGGFDKPMQADLLWVYEGLTNYLGEVLAARSGLWTPAEYRDHIANTAAMLDVQAGRAWRPLADMNRFIHYHNVTVLVPDGHEVLQAGDVVAIAGTKPAVEAAMLLLTFPGSSVTRI